MGAKLPRLSSLRKIFRPNNIFTNTTMGAIKDIYDIFSDVTAKMQANRLKKRGERSREELESYAEALETSVAELKSEVENLQREHTEEVAQLAAKSEQLIAQIAELKAPKLPHVQSRVGTKKGW